MAKVTVRFGTAYASAAAETIAKLSASNPIVEFAYSGRPSKKLNLVLGRLNSGEILGASANINKVGGDGDDSDDRGPSADGDPPNADSGDTEDTNGDMSDG